MTVKLFPERLLNAVLMHLIVKPTALFQTAEKLISKKGAENVLFASDCPWESPKKVAEFIDSLSISSKEKELIFSGNAKRILRI